MEFEPKHLTIGFFMVPQAPNVQLRREDLNRIWTDVNLLYPYTNLQMAPAGDGAVFVGATPDDMLTFQPPLLQFRERIELTPDRTAAKAQEIFKIAARHLGNVAFFNLGIKHIYHSPAPNQDAIHYVLGRVLSKEDAELADLRGGGSLWAGAKFLVSNPDGSVFTLLIEPLQADNRYIYLDLDAQFPGGPVPLDSIKDRCGDADGYITRRVREYLERR